METFVNTVPLRALSGHCYGFRVQCNTFWLKCYHFSSASGDDRTCWYCVSRLFGYIQPSTCGRELYPNVVMHPALSLLYTHKRMARTHMYTWPSGQSWTELQWNLSIEDTIGTQLAVLYTVEPLYRGHLCDPAGCPVCSGTSL